MALKNLTVEEMVQVSGAWTSPQDPAHDALNEQSRLAGLMPDLEAAHQEILLVAPEPENPRRAEIAELASEEDTLHDTLARGIHGMLTHLSLIVDNGAALLALRDQLMPEGLAKTIQSTYRGQAGWVSRLRAQMTPATREQLESVPLPGGATLFAMVDAWLDAGDRLGKLEEERARLEVGESNSFGSQVVAARNRWIRSVNALVGLAELSELDAETDRIVFGPLRDAETKAERRSARRKSDTTQEGSSEPAG